MELSKAYSEINRLLGATANQREAFKEAAYRLERESRITKAILTEFCRVFSAVRQGHYDDEKNIVSRVENKHHKAFGEVLLRFNDHDSYIEYKALKEMKKEELEKAINLYAPEEVEIKEIDLTTIPNTAIVIAKLKYLED